MNNTPLQLKLALLALVVIFLITIYIAIHKKKITVRYSVVWFAAALAMLIAALFTGSLEVVAKWLGIETVSNMIFLGGFAVLFIISFSLTVIVSSLRQRVITLTQEVGMLKQQVERNDHNENKNHQ